MTAAFRVTFIRRSYVDVYAATEAEARVNATELLATGDSVVNEDDHIETVSSLPIDANGNAIEPPLEFTNELGSTIRIGRQYARGWWECNVGQANGDFTPLDLSTVQIREVWPTAVFRNEHLIFTPIGG